MIKQMKIKQNQIPRDKGHDDGHTVADMNIAGMPWYQENRPGMSPVRQPQPGNPPGWKESLHAMAGIWKAGFLLTGIYSAVLILVVLFLITVWS